MFDTHAKTQVKLYSTISATERYYASLRPLLAQSPEVENHGRKCLHFVVHCAHMQ